MQKDVNRFIVPQAVPEIYRKNERLKNRGMCFFVIDCRNIFSGVGTAYRSLIREYRENFFKKLISVHCTFIRDLRVV